MKLFTHNNLNSKGLRGVVVGYPLKIKAEDVKVSEVEFDRDFLARIIPKLNWLAIVRAARQLGVGDGLPFKVVDDFENDEAFLKKAHHVILEVEVITGSLECPETGRKFPIVDGIPNMLVGEDESAFDLDRYNLPKFSVSFRHENLSLK